MCIFYTIDTSDRHCRNYRIMFFVCLIISVFIFGVLAQSRSVTVNPARANVDENATITYTFTSGPSEALVSLAWFKCDAYGIKQRGNIITNSSGNTQPNGRYSLSDNGSLIISSVKVEDAGCYMCIVITSSDGNTAKDFANLTVNYLRIPTLTPKEKYFELNKTAIFTCHLLDGVPTPIKTTWIKNGCVLDMSDTEKYRQSDTTLEVSRANEMDEGNYQCRAENAAYSGGEGKLSNIGTLSVILPLSTSVSSIAATVPQKCLGSDASLLVGLAFLTFVLGILLSSSIFVVLVKMRNPRTQLAEATSRDYELSTVSEAAPRNEKPSSTYTAYKAEPGADNKYEDLQWNYDNPAVYVNV